MPEPAAGRVLPFPAFAYRSSRPAGAEDLSPEQRAELARKAALCTGALAEAMRLVAASTLGPLLRQLLGRACELLDEMDAILVRTQPARESDAFAQAASLHRTLETIQAQLPREYRRWLVG